MAISIFRAFRSTVTPPGTRRINSNDTWLTDPTTGVVIGVQNQNANGADARFVPVDVTLAQLANPPAAMIADLDATYRINVAPYARYQSDGTQLVPVGGGGEGAVGGGGEFKGAGCADARRRQHHRASLPVDAPYRTAAARHREVKIAG